MDLSIVERLTCPNDHAMTPLVARADRTDGRSLISGLLGCPVCRGEWRVIDGVARFGAPADLAARAAPDAPTTGALLGLSEPERLVVVDGAPASLIAGLANEFGAFVVALDAAPDAGAAASIIGAPALPLGSAVHGALLLRFGRSNEFVMSVVRALVPRGRLLAPTELPRPHDIREIARDENMWVGEREAIATPVTLRRREG